jgi:hypothetical protein
VARYDDRAFTCHCGQLQEALKPKLSADPKKAETFLLEASKHKTRPQRLRTGLWQIDR